MHHRQIHVRSCLHQRLFSTLTIRYLVSCEITPFAVKFGCRSISFVDGHIKLSPVGVYDAEGHCSSFPDHTCWHCQL